MMIRPTALIKPGTETNLIIFIFNNSFNVPGLISAVGLIIIMLPQHAGPWVQVIQLKSLIAMSFIVLSYTVLSKK
jgi:hypothetical protein